MKQAPYILLYEDDEILVVYKNRDVLSIRTNDKKTYSHNLYHYLHLYLEKKKERLFIVHRLDYETSGVMIFAKSEEMKERLQKSFEERRVERCYEAVIKEKIPLGISHDVRMYLLDRGNGSRVNVSDSENGKEAITHIVSQNYIQIGTALKINIETGRRNQIRIALHELGYTLLGDKRYANDVNKRMYLNSYGLVFPDDLGLKVNRFIVEPLWIR
jgi:23S rRNA pseudouridine1911/1915/1917 synthase